MDPIGTEGIGGITAVTPLRVFLNHTRTSACMTRRDRSWSQLSGCGGPAMNSEVLWWAYEW
jgi:hypothetical protein